MPRVPIVLSAKVPLHGCPRRPPSDHCRLDHGSHHHVGPDRHRSVPHCRHPRRPGAPSGRHGPAGRRLARGRRGRHLLLPGLRHLVGRPCGSRQRLRRCRRAAHGRSRSHLLDVGGRPGRHGHRLLRGHPRPDLQGSRRRRLIPRRARLLHGPWHAEPGHGRSVRHHHPGHLRLRHHLGAVQCRGRDPGGGPRRRTGVRPARIRRPHRRSAGGGRPRLRTDRRCGLRRYPCCGPRHRVDGPDHGDDLHRPGLRHLRAQRRPVRGRRH